MKIGRISAPGKIEFIEKEIPEPKESGQVVVHLGKGAICGSDMRAFTHTHESYPLTDGVSLHECVGTVHSSRSEQFKEGDRVLYLPKGYIGLQEYFRVPQESVIHLPECESLGTILMGQLLGTVLFAMRKIGNIVLKNTVVQGAGPAGLLRCPTIPSWRRRALAWHARSARDRERSRERGTPAKAAVRRPTVAERAAH